MQHTENIFTSDFITRIVHNYDEFELRILKCNISVSDLNVLFLKGSRLRVVGMQIVTVTNIKFWLILL